MSFWRSLFGSPLVPADNAASFAGQVNEQQQAVIVRIDGTELSGGEDDIGDLATLEDLLQEALQDAGEVDGHDVGADDANIYCYGSDAEAMFAIMKPVLMAYPLSKKAIVTLRFGGLDSHDHRQVDLRSA